METLIQEPLSEILANYNIDVLNITNESYKDKKGVWWVNTSQGDKILKKVSNSEATLKFIISGVNYLIKNGVKIPNIIKTKNDMYYVKIDNICYVLSEAINGEKPSYDSPQELEIIARALGKFHKASSGFAPPYDSKPKNHLGTWVKEYTEYLEDMNKFYINEKLKKDAGPVGRIINQEFPYFYNRGKKSIEALKNSEYGEWVVKINKSGCLCHQDFSSANLLMNSSGIYVLDTDSIAIDLPARDIRKLLNKIMKKTGKWDIETVKNIIYWYQCENPLSSNEWRVVMIDLIFPHLFLGSMDKYYYKRDRTWNDENYLNRIKEMITFEKTISPLIQNFNSIIPEVKKKKS